MRNVLLSSTASTPLQTSGTTTITESGSFVSYTVTQTGLYTITADGAQGGSARAPRGPDVSGGLGAQVVGTFSLVAGETLRVAVGQAGGNAKATAAGIKGLRYGGGGGGGGTWVQLVSGPTNSLLEVAGGGGGSAYAGPNYAEAGGSGSVGTPGSGNGGNYVGNGIYGGGGGGYKSDGYTNTLASLPGAYGYGGLGFTNGLKGGAAGSANASGRSGSGGFGGGGGAGYYGGNGRGNAGGGGGYTGGTTIGTGIDAASGGSSKLASTATNTAETAGFRTGNGLVTITEQACFASGTLIETDNGTIAVENLRVGDRVRLAREHAFAPIAWLGHRSIDCARHPRPDAVMPVRVRAHAFGPGLPTRDLILSPDHAVFVDDMLIPVRHLLNGVTIVREPRAEITYWHVELARHDVLLAEGLACESYLDTGNRAAFANGGPVVSAHPRFDPVHAMAVWAADACAPLVTDGVERDAVHAVLLAFAADLGHETTDDPALALLVNGRVLRAARVAGVVRFDVPAGARTVRLLSRRFVPAELMSGARDHRTLGAAIIGLRIDGAVVDLKSLDAADGWLTPEADARTAWRWTDGDVDLHCPGARMIEVATGPAGSYWRAPVIVPAERARVA